MKPYQRESMVPSQQQRLGPGQQNYGQHQQQQQQQHQKQQQQQQHVGEVNTDERSKKGEKVVFLVFPHQLKVAGNYYNNNVNINNNNNIYNNVQ